MLVVSEANSDLRIVTMLLAADIYSKSHITEGNLATYLITTVLTPGFKRSLIFSTKLKYKEIFRKPAIV
jgi:hypothetical protein